MGLNVGGVEDILIKHLTISLVVTFETEHDRTTLERHLTTIILCIVVSHDAAHIHREV